MATRHMFAALTMCALSPVCPVTALADQGQAAPAVAIVQNDLAGQTVRFDYGEYGPGVLHFTKDGQAFLWKPGQLPIDVGYWTAQTIQITQGVENRVTELDIVSVFMPVSPNRKGRIFASLRAENIAADFGVVEVIEGDALGLAGGAPPCLMCRADMTFAQMLGQQ